MGAIAGIGRAWDVARAAWGEDRARPKAPARRRDELEFLPAAVEVMETPASPVGRLLAWLIVGMFTLALAWSWVGVLDVVAVASGKVVAVGRSKVIQPLEAGVVRAILVADGMAVHAGDVLLELDPTNTNADREHLTAELAAVQAELARLQAMLADDPVRAFAPPPGTADALARRQRDLLVSQVDELRARLAGLDAGIAGKRAELAGIEAEIIRLSSTLPLVRERADARLRLADQGLFPRLDALQIQEQAIQQEQDLEVLYARYDGAAAAITGSQRLRTQAEAEFRMNALTQLAEADKKVAGLTQELLKAGQRSDLQTLRAPIDGIVQQLAVYTVGGVVTPAQALLVIAPGNDQLEVEAMVLNKDVGFIAPGQEVAVKLETFLFTKYGAVPGRVVSISHDAVQDPKLGLVYPARIALDRTTLDVAGRTATLGPGMAVTAEIKTDQRRLIEYLLSPILRYRQESLRER